MENKLKVAVVFGGRSSEYSVSLHSVSSALRNMPEEFEIVTFGITSEGNWYLYEGPISSIEHDHWMEEKVTPATLSLNPKDHGFVIMREGGSEILPVDVIFPILHGINGEDGTLQGACSMAGIPCVGCGMTASTLCMDKEYTHIVADHAGVKMAKWICVRKHELADADALFEQVKAQLGIPCIIKPCNAGSSYGVSKAKDLASFKEGLEDAFRYDTKLIVEEFLNGFECGCAVMGNHELTLGEPDEIEIVTDIFDFTEKYNLISSRILVPARVSPEVKEKIYQISRNMYRAADCRGMARVDCFVCGDEVLLNEINTIPGFTDASRYPTMMDKAGHPFKEVLRELVYLAKEEN